MGKKNKEIRQENVITRSKDPRTVQNPNSFHGQRPIWAFSCCDFEHSKWGISNNPRALDKLLKKLKAWEGQTWGEILSDTSGRNCNSKNHSIETYKIIKEARDRLVEINLSQYDSLYSLSVTGTMRLWGTITNGIFMIIWIDEKHEICPVGKRHT